MRHSQEPQDVFPERMLFDQPFRLVGTRELREIAATTDDRDYNRGFGEDIRNKLHPEGVHILRPVMIHEHRRGVHLPEDEFHVRCFAYLRMRDDTEGNRPLELIVDIDRKQFNALPGPPDFVGEVEDV